jgi:4-aminobutyrate aminotransferase-like enzyme
VQGNILRFVPPLVITRAEIDALMGCLDGIFSSMLDAEGKRDSHA